MRPIRNSVKAIIIKDGKLLAIKKQDGEGFYYILPGGGQEIGEDFVGTAKRECLEEIGAEIVVGDLRFVREYIGKHHEFADEDGEMHQVEFMFWCHLQEGAVAQQGHAPDEGQLEISWLETSRLDDYRLYPKILKSILSTSEEVSKAPVYLGDVN